MEERFDIKQREFRHLAGEYEKNPELFAQKAFVEDTKTLNEFGIWIPGKETCGQGLLKLWPEDFIVEEQSKEGGSSVTNDGEGSSTEGQTVYATLVKCGLSTIEAVEDIAKKLALRVEDISYAGIKDKDALTAQAISVRRASPEAVRQISSSHFFLKDIRSGKGVVEKGGLTGNRFTILVRTPPSFLEGKHAAIFMEKLEIIQKYGFYNFFYLQRFGTPRLHNFAWARLILQGKYEEAVRDILAFEGERELPYFIGIRRRMKDLFGRWDEILKLIEPLPLMFRHEHRLVGHLAAHPGDYVGALQKIPEQITLWMYALSSLLFNQYISNCLMGGEEPPEKLPFFLARERNSYEPYREMLEALAIYPPPFQNLRPFSQVQLKEREALTKDHVKIHKAEVVKEGIVLQFDLGKGQYATTLLSHLFDLVVGTIPNEFPKARIDTKAVIGEESLSPVLEKFTDVIRAKGENMFEMLIGKNE